MSHHQYAPTGVPNLSDNGLNRRSQSFLAQNCSNYPPSSHLSSIQYVKPASLASKTPPPGQYASNSKENFLQVPRKTIISAQVDDQTNTLQVENERLRRQLQQQKEQYELEMNKLRKNVTLKDQLLDQCEAEIAHLKATYIKFIQQNPPKPTQNNQEPPQNTQIGPQTQKDLQITKVQAPAQNGEKVDAGLIPLSIVPKRSSSLRELPSGGRPVHGLIRRG